LKNSAQKISGYFLLILFLGVFCSNTFFEHIHLYNSEIIVHSHPFKHGEDGKPMHSHTSNGYILVIMANNLVNNTLVSLALISIVLFASVRLFFSETICTRFRNDRTTVLLRGPPDAMLS
jgi:hypothetical protein